MTPEEFKDARYRLGLSVVAFAQAFGISGERTVRRWEDGSKDIPQPVVLLVQMALMFPSVRRFLGVPAWPGDEE